jgi:hypothetical protein
MTLGCGGSGRGYPCGAARAFDPCNGPAASRLPWRLWSALRPWVVAFERLK